MSTEGVDYAFDPPSPAALAEARKRFACRYGGPGSIGKQLSAREARELTAAGVSIVANAEGIADGLLGGWDAGRMWAAEADLHFRQCGMPTHRPIYLSVDFDVSSGQWPAVRQALHGAGAAIGSQRVGVYGGLNAVRWARRDGCAEWYWQTYAWSGGLWAAGNHIEQYRNGVQLGSGTVDLDRAHPVDYGQWTVPGVPGPGGGIEVITPDEVKDIAAASATATHFRDIDPGPATLQFWRAAYAIYEAALHTVKTTDDILAEVRALATVDEQALAAALAADESFVDALATAIAAKLAGSAETLTLTGTVTGTIAPTA